MNKQWIDKYIPKSLNEMILSPDNINKIKTWMKDYKKDPVNAKKILLICGPPGTGKTLLAHLLLKKFGYRPREYNASELRSSKKINEILNNVFTFRNIIDMIKNGKSPIGIILDEIEAFSDKKGEGKGGLKFLLNNIKRADNTIKKKGKNKNNKVKINSPIICTYNDFKDKKLTLLKKYSVFIKLKRISDYQIEKLTNKILKSEGFKIKLDAKMMLIQHAMGDIRRLIYILHFLCIKLKDSITLKDVEKIKNIFTNKTVEMEIYEMTKYFINNGLSYEKITKLYYCNTMLLPLMLYDNFYKVLLTKKKMEKQDVKTMISSVNCIVEYDILQNHIIKDHEYTLSKYNAYRMYELNYILVNNRKNKFVPVNFAKILNKTSNYYTAKKKINKLNMSDYNLIKNIINVNEKVNSK